MDELVKQIVLDIQKEKSAMGIVPNAALFQQEVMPRLRKAAQESVNMMVKSGDMDFHSTLNDIALTVKE